MTWGLDWHEYARSPRQLVFRFSSDSCSRCGKTEWGTQMVYDGEAVAHVIPGAKVTWRCVVCDELVCGDCVQCKPLSENSAATLHPMFMREIWDVTYCSPECRALNVMSHATPNPLVSDIDARDELHRCPECLVWMHVSAGRCCSTLCDDVQYVRSEISRWRSRP